MSLLPNLETLIKIEATLWMNARGTVVSLPLEEFYALVRTHEWTSSLVSGDAKDEKLNTTTKMQANVTTKLSKQADSLVQDLSDEERLLFSLLAISGWKPSEMTPKLYPLFQIVTKGSKGENTKYQLEMLNPPESVSLAVSSPNSVSPTKAKLSAVSVSRSEVLRNMYVQSKTLAALTDNSSSHADASSWWGNASCVAKMIIAHRELNEKKLNTKTEDAETAKKLFTTAATANDNDQDSFAGKKMTLEERVRAKSQLRKRFNSTSTTIDKTFSATALRQTEEKALLELADALRSYSQRRGGDTNNVARLPMSDFMKDAAVAWNAIVRNENADKAAGGATKKEKSRTIASPVTSIDLSRVLFHLRLKISCGAGSKGVDSGDTSNKRQMENYITELLRKLASTIPNWIHLRDIPSSLSTTAKEGNSKEPLKASHQSSKSRKSMRNNIIVIRNDAVNYANDVRAKLGGRTHQSNTLGKVNSGKSNMADGGKKRSLKDFLGQNKAAADAIVPPSFLKRWDKALKK